MCRQTFESMKAYEEKIRSVFPSLPEERMLARLRPAAGKKRIVLDTDAFNEVDDQFALAYALRSPELSVEAVYAAPFYNERSESPEDGMEKSYAEILRLMAAMGVAAGGRVFKGSGRYMGTVDTPVDSPAVRDLIRRARAAMADDPLYVVAIGAATGVASALRMAPDICGHIVVVWLGGDPARLGRTLEFNLRQDIPASRLLFDCGVPLVQIPCATVASHLLTCLPELENCLQGKNQICDALIGLFRAYRPDHHGWAKELWDISAVAYVVNPEWTPGVITRSPILSDQLTWSADESRHFMRVVTSVRRNAIFADLYRKLGGGPA